MLINGFEVEGITLLSEDRALKIPTKLKKCKINGADPVPEYGRWWLKDTTTDWQDNAPVAYAMSEDGLCCSVKLNVSDQFSENGISYVRPALVISNLRAKKLKRGDEFTLLGNEWVKVGNDIALSLYPIGECSYREDEEAEDLLDFNASDIKRFIVKWYEERVAEYNAQQ